MRKSAATSSAEEIKSNVVNQKIIKKGFPSLLHFNYQEIEKNYMASACYRFFALLKSKFSGIDRIKRKIAEKTEQSIICGFAVRVPDILLSAPLRSYGIVVFFYSIFSFVVNLIFLSTHGGEETAELLTTVISACIMLCMSGFLSSSHKSLGSLLANSVIVSFLFSLVGFDVRKADRKNDKTYHNSVFVVIGVFLGIVFGLIPQFYLILSAFAVLLILAVIMHPETGVILTFLILPFASEKLLLSSVSVCLLAVFLKTVRNKRVMKFTAIDIIVLLFTSLVLIGGFNGIGDISSAFSSLRLIILIVFGWIMNNTIRTTVLSEKCVRALVISATVVSLIGILLFFFDMYCLDSKHLIFELIGKYLRSFALNGSVSEITVLVIPFAFSLRRNNKLLGSIASVLCMMYSLLSLDFSIWLSLIFISVLFWCIVHPTMFLYFGIVITLLSIVNYFFPEMFSAFSSFVENFSDKSELLYTVKTSNDLGITAIREFLYSGSGAGSDAIAHVFGSMFGSCSSGYCLETSLFVRIILHYGVVGVFLIFVAYLFFIVNCLNLFYSDKLCKKELKFYVVSCFVSFSLVVFRGLLFPFASSSNLILCSLLVFYLSFSFRKCSLTEYVPDTYEQLYNNDFD